MLGRPSIAAPESSRIDEQTPVADRVIAHWHDAKRHRRDKIQIEQQSRDFLWKQQHYANDPGVSLDDCRIAPKGAELNDLWRYKLAQCCAEGPYLETHPRDQQQDPFAAEYAKRILYSIIDDPTNRYDAIRRRVIGGSLGVGTWYAMAHWNPDRGPMGDIVFETLGMDQVLPCPGYLDLHDPCCPYVHIERRETMEALKAKGYDVEGLWPDCGGKYQSSDEWEKASGHPSDDEDYEPPKVTVIYGLYRSGGDDTYAEDGGYRDLSSEDQYMACASCGYMDRMHQRDPQDGTLPEVGAECPQCFDQAMAAGKVPEPSYLYRVSREKLTEHRLKYPDGKMCIVAPHQRKLLYEGPWQSPTRSFPIWQQRAYEIPYEQEGGTDTLLYWSLQGLMDLLRKQACDQMVTSKPLLIMAESADGGPALVDARGNPFLFTDENGQIAYAKNIAPGMPIQSIVHQFQGNGMPGSFPTLYGILSQAFYQSRGIGQVQFGPEQSKDVAYRSLMLQHETGDVPVDDHKQIIRREEGLFLGCVLDIWVHNSSSARAIRYLGEDGQMEFQLLKGSDIPSVDVIVGTPPQIKQGMIDEAESLAKLDQIQNQGLRRVFARKLGLSPSEIAEVEKGAQEMMQMAQAQQMQQQSPNGMPAPSFAAAPGGASPPLQ